MVLSELANIVFNDEVIPKLADGYRQYLMEQNKDGMTIITVIKSQLSAIQKEMDNIMSVIAQTASSALVGKLNELDDKKKDLISQLHKAQEQCKVKELTEDELLRSFKQARELIKTGKLSNIKALIERYVQKVIVSGNDIEIQFNLNVSSRIVTYPATSPKQKETPQHTRQDDFVMFFSYQPLQLATCGGPSTPPHVTTLANISNQAVSVRTNRSEFTGNNINWVNMRNLLAALV